MQPEVTSWKDMSCLTLWCKFEIQFWPHHVINANMMCRTSCKDAPAWMLQQDYIAGSRTRYSSTWCSLSPSTRQKAPSSSCQLALHTSLMLADAVGDLTQGHTASPLVLQAAPSDDCSAITLGTSTALDCATSFPVQHAQHSTAHPVTALDSSTHQQTAAEDASIALNSHRLLRKRKQPDRSCPPPSQARSKQSQLHSNPNIKGNTSDGKRKNENKPASIVQMLSYRQGKQKGSEASEGQSSLEGSQGSICSVPSSAGTLAGTTASHHMWCACAAW